MDTFKHTPKGSFPAKTKMRMCQTCHENCLNLGSSDEEFDGEAPTNEANDDLASETAEQSSIHYNINLNPHSERIPAPALTNQLGNNPTLPGGQDPISDSFQDVRRKLHKPFDYPNLNYSDDDEDYESSDEDSVIYHSQNNINSGNGSFYSPTLNQSAINPPSISIGSANGGNASIMSKWETYGQSRSPSRSQSSFRRHRSGTSLSAELSFPMTPKTIRMGQRKKSFTARPKPSFSSIPPPTQSLVAKPRTSNGSLLSSPLIDLNNASIAHAKAFLRQVLEQRGMPGKLSKWIDALMPPLLQCTSHINLDLKVSEGSDFRKFVKLKRIPGGLPSHSEYIDGVVFSQSLPLKSMPRKIVNPSFLLAVNLFEHPRLHVSRIIEVSSQEKQREDTLKRRVVQLGPSVVLTTGGASRSVLNKLAERGITVLINVKRSVIDRISRYTKVPIINYESLSYNTQLGNCKQFEVKTFRYGHEVKKYIFLSGIPRELGCTVLLRGADMASLGSVKRIVQLMVYIMFNLKLETALLREEYALVPDVPPMLKKIDKIRQKDKTEGKSNGSTQTPPPSAATDSFHDLFNPALVEDKLLSTSPFVDYGLPYLLQVVQKSEDQLVAIDQDKESRLLTVRQIVENEGLQVSQLPGGEETINRMAEYLFDDMSKKLYDTWSKQNKQWQNVFLRNPDMFSPEFHLQSVLLYTSVCTATATPCYGPELLTFCYYNDKMDMPLGHFIERLCLEAKSPCSEGCGQTLKNHTRSYAHGKGNLTITIKDHSCSFPGMADSIFMWSTCKVCSVSTPILPMSDDTWQYSLGKYFELSFWSSGLSFRENVCPHNLYRDHVRFFGFKNMAVSIEYNEIVPYEVTLPSTRVEWVPERGMKLKASFYSQIVKAIEKFYESVSLRLQSVKVDELAPENIEQCRSRVEELLTRTEDEKRQVFEDLNRTFVETSPTSYLPLNGVLRSMQGYAIFWDYEFTDFENSFFPSEKDITRITAAHLKKLFLPEDIYEKKQQLSEKARKQSMEFISKVDTNEKAVLVEKEQATQSLNQTDIPEPNDTIALTESQTNITEKDETLFEKDSDVETVKPLDDLTDLPKSENDDSPTSDEQGSAESEDRLSTETKKADEKPAKPADEAENGTATLETSTETSNPKDSQLTEEQLADDSTQTPESGVPTKDGNSPTPAEKVAKAQSFPNAAYEDEESEQKSNLTNDLKSVTRVPRVRSAVNVSFTNSADQLRNPNPLLQDSIPDLMEKSSRLQNRSPSPGTRREGGRVQEAISRMESSQASSSTASPKVQSASPSFVNLSDKTGLTVAPVSSNSDSSLQLAAGEKPAKTTTVVKQPLSGLPSVSFKARPSSIPVLKVPDRDSLSSDRMMEYAKLRLKYNPQVQNNLPSSSGIPRFDDSGNKSTLSNNLKFQSKFDKIGYSPGVGFRNKFNTPLGSSWAPGAHSIFNRPEGGNGSTSNGISRVSSLAKHFEQLSKEFEKERARERKMLAQTQYRAVPVATSKPIVEVYQNVKDAVEELSQSEDESSGSGDESSGEESAVKHVAVKDKVPPVKKGSHRRAISLAPEDMFGDRYNDHFQELGHKYTNNSEEQGLSEEETSAANQNNSLEHSKTDDDTDEFETNLDEGSQDEDSEIDEECLPKTSEEAKLIDDEISPSVLEEQPTPCSSEEPSLQPNERQGLLQSLASFWADRSATGWRPLEYPLSHSDHMFADSDVIVREDEPSSLIAFCLSYPDYREKLRNLRSQEKAFMESEVHDEASEMERHMLKNTGTHLKYQFQERSAKLSCKIFYAEQFDAIRRQCDCDESFIQSLSRCIKWDSSGGKSGSAFLKTLDDRLVVKQLSPAELDAFVKFAPSYFEFMAQAFFHDLPTALAKIFGFYQIQMRNPITHKSFKMDVLVMENLFYDHKTSRIFDLKGSMRNRHVKQTGRENEVLLDENMVEFIYESPLFVRNHSKTSLRLSLFNDTLFLAKMNVMDYSLVVAIDDERQELIVGIIDFIRTFTWDKKLESWVKERGLVGGGVKEPTVVSPKQYKFRFREAMERYIMMVPDCWHPVYKDEDRGDQETSK